MKMTGPWFTFRAGSFYLRVFSRLPVLIVALFFAPGSSLVASAQNFPGNGILARSFSGQFIVTGSNLKSPLLNLPGVVTNAAFVRLEPALLSVSAERIKQTLFRLLAVPNVRQWQGKIYLTLHPALRTDENVTVISRPIDRSWSYLVELPDVVEQARFLRGLTGVLLLEMANRQGAPDGHAAEIPSWLIDGLSRQMLQNELARVVLSAPDRSLDNPLPARRGSQERDLDPLAGARRVLRQNPALTFDQLCWPTGEQLAGYDGGTYNASAQLFVSELLKLEDGPASFRQMLASLPQCYNWQTAFQNAFRSHFARPLDLEKWWALQVVGFLSHDPGPSWTPDVSAVRLDELLSVPVEMRQSSNALPSHAEISLQGVLHDFTPAQQSAIFQTRLRDLRIAQLRMAPQFIALTDDYCRVLAGYLGERLGNAPRQPSLRHPVASLIRLKPGEAVKRLDALDARRRVLKASLPASPSPARNS